MLLVTYLLGIAYPEREVVKSNKSPIPHWLHMIYKRDDHSCKTAADASLICLPSLLSRKTSVEGKAL